MFMDAPISWWAGFFGLIAVLLAFDLGVLHRKEHEIRVKEALGLSLFYIILAMCFAALVFTLMGKAAGYEFVTGYLIEKTLSLDNIFVFVLIFGHFGVPRLYQHRVLFWGILGAILMRGLLIGAGAALLKELSWIMYVFGAFLIFTGIKMLLASDGEPDIETNRVLMFVKRNFRITPAYHGHDFLVKQDGRTWATPLLLVLILIEFSDVIFALDSIPAIFAVTQEPFIIFTSNIFAILGLRALYFALSVIIHRFHYLKYGLSVILVLIGAKMVVNHYYESSIISTELSLFATLLIIAVSIVVSLAKTRGQTPQEVAMTGWIPGCDTKPVPPPEH